MNTTHPLRLLALSVALMFGFSGAAVVRAADQAPAGIHVTNAWIRSLPAGVPLAGYLTITNDSAQAVVLRGVSSPEFAMAHLHQSYTGPDGNSHMRMVPQLRIPAHGTVRLAPGGYHLMLMGPRKDLKPGDTATLELHFEGGKTVHVPMSVKPADYTG